MQIINLNKNNFKEVVEIASVLIKEGRVVVVPTDTVYGLVADAVNKKTIGKVFKIKCRKKKNPIPIFIKDIKEAKKIAKINKEQENFLRKVWPGGVTVILERKKGLKIYGVDNKTIALRIPKYKLIDDILKKVNLPLSGTSANISGRPAAASIEELSKQFKGVKNQPDLVVDAGKLKTKKSSTVIDLTIEPYNILRP
ncbi:MAG: L-threonylcarbamoyladenylate synthase [Candidatus Pacebacteria bacterium]|nr:L-threonylcarbamoyladenylate synthase [Candidatus Paceibacterota bacterium]